MSDNFDKIWFQDALNVLASNRALEAIQSSGLNLPCKVTAVSGSIVTVTFEVDPQWKTLPPLTLPKAESQWMRSPTQEGDFGFTVSASTYLGGVSGLGDGVADPTVDYGNLTKLVWVPVAALKFPASPDVNKAWMNGPKGAVVSDAAQTVVSTHDATTKSITHAAGVGTSSQVKTIYDGEGNAISHVVSAGGKIGLGDLAGNLASARAASVQADLQTLANNIVSTTLQTLATAIGNAAVTTGLGPGAAAFAALLGGSGWVSGLSGINPTIPNCSSIVRIAP